MVSPSKTNGPGPPKDDGTLKGDDFPSSLQATRGSLVFSCPREGKTNSQKPPEKIDRLPPKFGKVESLPSVGDFIAVIRFWGSGICREFFVFLCPEKYQFLGREVFIGRNYCLEERLGGVFLMRQFGAIWSDLLRFPGTFWDGLFVVASNLICIPGTQTTSIFEGQPPKTRPSPIKTRVI